jgi:hypothetical protein
MATITILGNVYNIRIADLAENMHGHCDTDLLEIAINRRLTGEDVDKTLFHEVLHAALHESGWAFAMDEAAISEEGIVLALEHALWRLGVRLPDTITQQLTTLPVTE